MPTTPQGFWYSDNTGPAGPLSAVLAAMASSSNDQFGIALNSFTQAAPVMTVNVGATVTTGALATVTQKAGTVLRVQMIGNITNVALSSYCTIYGYVMFTPAGGALTAATGQRCAATSSTYAINDTLTTVVQIPAPASTRVVDISIRCAHVSGSAIGRLDDITLDIVPIRAATTM